MAQFHVLTVTAIHKTIKDAVAVTLSPPQGADFSFKPGQYLTFRKDFDGEELRRSYSICSGLDDETLQVGIKRVDGGAFSSFANDELRIGDILEAMPPQGRFQTKPTTSPHHYLAFAGGSGITPILSILKTVLKREPKSRFTLVYANRAINSIMFKDELEDLKNTHMDRLNIIHILENDAEEIELFKGRVDAQKCDDLFAKWINIDHIDTALICGPEPMMLTIREALARHGISKEQIKFELFASGQPGRAAQKPVQENDKTDSLVEATVMLDGIQRQFEMPKDATVLEGALAQNIEVPYSCTAGVCSTCMAMVKEGEVEMKVNHALEDYEVERGFVLTCQCLVLSDRIVLDYDTH